MVILHSTHSTTKRPHRISLYSPTARVILTKAQNPGSVRNVSPPRTFAHYAIKYFIEIGSEIERQGGIGLSFHVTPPLGWALSTARSLLPCHVFFMQSFGPLHCLHFLYQLSLRLTITTHGNHLLLYRWNRSLR